MSPRPRVADVRDLCEKTEICADPGQGATGDRGPEPGRPGCRDAKKPPPVRRAAWPRVWRRKGFRLQRVGRGRLMPAGRSGRRRGACGFIFLALKFCDNLGYDFPWMKKRSAIPLLFLEGDYQASPSGQLLTRVQAFVETLPPPARS